MDFRWISILYVGEYSLKQVLIKELLEIAEKYPGRIKDKTIAEAAMKVVKKYES